jgi:phospholipase C
MARRDRLAQGVGRQGLSTRALDALRADVLANRLPQISWVVSTAEGSEHPGPSSPAQGAAYTARVIEALTANPEVWARTVLFINFDENDGFFDHAPPPAPPSADPDLPGGFAGASTVSTQGEYHRLRAPGAEGDDLNLRGRPYGLGPRVPMYVLSPWSRGGRVHSEVSDHTSVIRFMERASAWPSPTSAPGAVPSAAT